MTSVLDYSHLSNEPAVKTDDDDDNELREQFKTVGMPGHLYSTEWL